VSGGWSIPWGLAWLPNGSALLTERNTHRVYTLSPSGTKTQVGTVPNVVNGGEGGLLGVAVSPNFATDRYVYFFHTASGDNRVARMTFDGSSLGGYTPILTGIRKATYHNGGRIAFGPDGHLYVATGDAQQTSLSQDRNALNGKILRITATGQPAPGNPFGTAVYSIGHRNPQGLAWDAQGRLWSSELGNTRFDELNLIESGKNYGWPTCEGTCSVTGMTNPKRTWTTAEASPSGLAYADGALYMATLRGQRLWRIPLNGTEAGTPAAYYTGTYGRLRAVAKLPNANGLWVTTSNVDANGGRPAGSDQVLQVNLG
jgi:glucose/arabinose dehydrogenase